MSRPLRVSVFVLCLLAAAALGAGGMYLIRGRLDIIKTPGHPSGPQTDERREAGEDHDHEPGVVELTPEKVEAAGIEVAPAHRDRLTLTRWITGKIAPNGDRLAHIYSLVEGTVHEVLVPFGATVKQGDVLAVIDCKEVGQAKLALVRARLEVRIAKVNQDWKQKIHQNTQALIQALEGETSPQVIADRFRDRPMGTYREDLISASAHWQQTRAQFDRMATLSQRGSVSQSQFEQARAENEAARATFNALMEQIKFTSEQELIQARQALEQAQVAEGASRSALYILGYSEDEVARMDPLAEGEEVAHYALTAPFDGTILAKDVVVEERVGPQTRLFDLADLSTVWVQADIYEKDLRFLQELNDRVLRFRTSSYPDQLFKARVFTTGEVVDSETRTVRMTAVAENPDRRLKPGLFVEIELPIGSAENVVQIPQAALQTDAGQTFVFVRRASGEFARREVTVGRAGAQNVEITEGLQAGEPVAIRGSYTLKAELKREELGEGGHSH